MTPSHRLRQLADELFQLASDAGPGPVDDLLTAAAREALSAACFAAEGERKLSATALASGPGKSGAGAGAEVNPRRSGAVQRA
jgi:hypothetical protein